MNELEELAVAEAEVKFLEECVSRMEDAVLAPLREVIHIDSDLQAFIYVGDSNGMIAIKQDAHFVAEGILVDGEGLRTLLSGNHTPIAIGVTIASLVDGPTITGGTSVVATDDSPPAYTAAYTRAQKTPEPTQSVPNELFVPFFRSGDQNPGWQLNTDYWHVLAAEWLNPKGRVLQFSFRADVPTGGSTYTQTITPPSVGLVGYKVNG